ncbi:MAG: hypothetical protein ISS94_05970 [Candidatus Syntrophoarchaeum sp.]|nr:hypothetical protein [Candidatus Syntrophoarchaeum sp.]
MNENIFRFKEIVIDTGPLLLYLIGFYRIRDLRRFNYDKNNRYSAYWYYRKKEIAFDG